MGLIEWNTTTMSLQFDPDKGILYVAPNPDFMGTETPEDARENVLTSQSKTGEKLKAVVAEMPNHYISAAVTRVYRELVNEVPLALVASTSFQKMIGNFLLTLASPKRPTKLFTSKASALVWIRQILEVPIES